MTTDECPAAGDVDVERYEQFRAQALAGEPDG